MKQRNNEQKNVITKTEDIKKLGTIMGVWAHPDDETFTSAGIMAAAVKNGQKVVCVTATKGESGVQDEARWPATELGTIREKELLAAMRVIGVTENIFLSYQDGACIKDDRDAIRKITELIDIYQPDTILTFGKDGMTGHPDHQAVCDWAVQAVRHSQCNPVIYHSVQTKGQYETSLKEMDRALNIYYNIDKPRLCEPEECDICFSLDAPLREIKYSALQVMPSQTEKMLKMFSKDVVCNSLSPEAFIREP